MLTIVNKKKSLYRFANEGTDSIHSEDYMHDDKWQQSVCFEILSSFPITSFDYNFHDTQNDTFHRRLSSPQDLSVSYFKVD